jgi:HD-GYP domain-containing protein (c-di-GMP phosphodiesterase class II)
MGRSGYPDGLAAGDIRFGARVIAVCDAFDAMISDRPYAPPRAVDEALAELRRCAGTQFDAAIVSVFEQLLIDRAKRPTAAAA